MIRTQNVTALFIKQFKDTLKNIPVLILFIVYPCIAFVMTQAMPDQAGTRELFVSVFATMHCVFTPIVATAGIIAEEKEKNTLRVLIMSNVTLREYFISIGGFILIADFTTGFAFLFLSGYSIAGIIQFLLSLASGALISIVVGICIGLYARNTGAANGLAVPCGMVFAFMPMLSFFNKSIETVSRYTYGQQVGYLLSGKSPTLLGIAVLIVNAAIFVFLAAKLYQRSLSEE